MTRFCNKSKPIAMAMKVYDNLSVNANDFRELSCKECAKGGQYVDSLNYCVECRSLYCLECLKTHQDNNIIRKNNEWKNQPLNHHPKHGLPTLVENNNNRYHSIDCMVQIQQKENKLRQGIRNQLEQVNTRLNQMMEAETTAKQDRLDKLRANTEDKLNNLISSIMTIVDDIKSAMLDNIDKVHAEIEGQFSDKVTTLRRLQTKTEAAMKKLADIETGCEEDLKELEAFANLTKEDADKIEQDSNSFYNNITEKVIKAEWQTLDAIHLDAMDDFICHIHALVEQLQQNNADEDDQLKGDTPLVECNIQHDDDQSLCDINSSCFMTDGTVVLTDWNNGNIKWLDTNFDIIDVCALPGIPWAACSYSQTEVLVSVHLLQRIQWVKLGGDKMQLGKSFKVRNPCKGVACCSDKIFVTCGGNGLMDCQGQIQVYDSEGILLQTFINDHSENQIFSNPQHLVLAINGSEHTLHIADIDLGLIRVGVRQDEPNLLDNSDVTKVDTQGTVAEAKALCLGVNKCLFLTDFKQGNIICIENSHNDCKVTEVVPSGQSISNPNSVCFNADQMKLVVTICNCNVVRVYDLTNWRHAL